MLEKETRTYDTPQWRDLCGKSQMCFDPKLQKRVKEMQVKAQKTHTGEERWTNVDRHFIEVCSSSCAIVGFSVGYSVALGKKNNGLCQSRQGDAEVTIDWDLMPPLCRPDNVNEKHAEIKENRQKKRKARQPGAPRTTHARSTLKRTSPKRTSPKTTRP